MSNLTEKSNSQATIQIPNYKILETIHSGNKTLVYRAIRTVDQLSVVIKLLKNPYPSFSELVQFRNHYTITKDINSPLIIKTYNLELYKNIYALVMEDFGGISLKKWKNEFSLIEFLEIAIPLSNVLEELSHVPLRRYLRDRIVHKNINPHNILINPETKQIKLIDFSVASLLPRETQTPINPNLLEGTLAYISPEQTGRMNRGIDYRTDFYSLGITFYELLTGKLPFESEDVMELVHSHLAKAAPQVHEINAEIPLVLSNIVNKLMAKNAEDRYQSALGLKYDLEQCLTQLQQTGEIKDFKIAQRDISDRFIIPDKLYGRETEVQELLTAFAKVSLGATEMMLVAGFSGIGKTAVVNEVHKPIVKQRGYFIKGKFDQFNRNIPFSAFVQAFRSLMGQLLGESDSELQQWQANILKALGEQGQVIIKVIPELEQITGEQPPVAELEGSAAQNRFNRLFNKFVGVFATKEHPLVIFLDDLQWVDSASLNLINVLISGGETQHLLILGAYRDNEVSPVHPLMLTLSELAKAEATLSTISLAPLGLHQVNQLVSETLSCTPEIAQPLTELIYQKTKGNPFFATQFLKGLYEDRLIIFNSNLGCWECDLVKVRDAALTEDVVEFMAGRLQKLPAQTQDVLKLAACIGNQFELETLAVICEEKLEETAANLWSALQEGFILPMSEAYKFFQGEERENIEVANVGYRFLHDRVQQAAYSLIPQNQKQSTHLKLGNLLLNSTSTSEIEGNIFAIVNQLNFGSTLIKDRDKCTELAQLNLLAGRKAKAATAYGSAIEYFSKGCNLLAEDCWETSYTLALTLFECAVETAYLNGSFEPMQEWVTIVLQNANTFLDKVKIYDINIQALTAQNKLREAVSTGLEVLEKLEISFGTYSERVSLEQGIEETNSYLSGWEIEELINLPEMTDINRLAAMQIISTTIAPAYVGEPDLLPLLVLKQINLSVEFGNTELSTYAYVMYGLILCGVLGDIELGYQFGQLANKLLNKFECQQFECRILNIFNAFIRHWKEPLYLTIQSLEKGYKIGIDRGDIEFVGYCALNYGINSFWSGQELTEFERKLSNYTQAIGQFNQQTNCTYLKIYWQLTLNLLNVNKNPCDLNGSAYQAVTMLPVHQQANDAYALAQLYLAKLFISYLFYDFSEAIATAELGQTYVGALVGNAAVPIFPFYDSLARLAVGNQPRALARENVLKLVTANQQKMQHWADHSPENYLSKFYLVEAEKHRVLGQKLEAIDFYDRAIAGAKENGFIQEEALGNELAAKFYLDWGKEKFAALYMQEAYYCYAKWGAKAKIHDLEQRYPDLLKPILQEFQSANPIESLAQFTTPNLSPYSSFSSVLSSAKNSSRLDFVTVLKASQVLLEKIEIDALLTEFVRLILQNSGADKLVIVLPDNDDSWQVRAIATPEITQLSTAPLTEDSNLPIQLIRYVKNSQKIIAIDDLDTELPIVDAYLQEHQPHSVLCLPILHQGHLSGLLYLQNQAITGVFNRDRLLVLNFLCTQAAIALENARLFAEQQQSAIDLQVNNSFLKAQQESSLDGMLVINANRQVTAYNERFASIWNIPKTVLETKDDRQLLAYVLDRLENPTAFLAKVEYLYDHPEESSFDEIVLKNQRVLERYSSPVKLPSGEYSSRIWYFRDISDRKAAEQELILKQNHLEALLNNIPHIAWVKDSESRFVAVNEPLAKIMRCSPAEMVGKTDYDFFPAEMARIYQEDDIEVLASGQRKVVEERIRRGDGSLSWLETTKTPFRDAQGQFAGTVGIAADITDRKQAEQLLADYNCELERQVEARTQALQVSEARLQLALSATNQGFFDLNLPTGVAVVSSQYALMLGYDPATFRETEETWRSRLHPDDREQTHRAYRAYKAGQTPQYKAEFRLQTQQGDWQWILSVGQFVAWDETGQPTRLLGTHTDISDRRLAEIERQRAENALQNLIEGTAALTGPDFFAALVRHIATALDASHAFVTELVEGDRLHFLVAWGDGQYLPNDTVDIEGTTCAVTLDRGAYHCKRDVIACFPQNPILAPMGVDSYMGVALQNRQGEVIGTLCVFARQPLADPEYSEQILRVFAARAAVELERQQAEIVINQQLAAIEAAIDSISILQNGVYRYVNQAHLNLFGYENAEELIGKSWKCLYPSDEVRRFEAEILPGLTYGQGWQGEAIAIRKDGSTFAQGVSLTLTEDGLLISVCRDISELKQAQALITHNALHDSLTGLPNRTLLLERLTLAMQRTQRQENYRYAIFFIDLDRFKVVNDSLGHTIGDQLLMAITQRLKTHVRQTDLVARLGGDEFVVLIEDIGSTREITQIAERILADSQAPLFLDGHQIVTGMSIGIVLGKKDYQDATDIIRDADIAMYQAKTNGRNSYYFFDTAMHAAVLDKLSLESDLRQAVDQQEFVVYYQPVFELSRHQLIGLEALVRWQHPKQGLITPDKFIPIAEETGLIQDIDSWVMHHACQQVAAWQKQFSQFSELKISLNLSAQDLGKADLIQRINEILKTTGLSSQSVTLEITESFLIDDIEKIAGLLRQLTKKGMQISIDDFGTGYSSLSYLHRLPFCSLKIDRSFISQMESNSRNHKIVSTIIALGQQLGLSAIAEGVETPQQLQLLQQLGCQFGQGYLFSKPLSAQEIETILQGMSGFAS